MEGSPSLYVTTLPGLVKLGIVLEIKKILIYHVTSRDHVEVSHSKSPLCQV